MDEIFVTRESQTKWRFDYHTFTPFHLVSDKYHEVDKIMSDEGHIPDLTKFTTHEDKKFTLWQTYRKDLF